MQAWIVTKKLLDYSYILLIKDHESGTVHYRKLHKAFKTHHRFLKAGWVGDLANTRRPWAAFHSKSGWYWLTTSFLHQSRTSQPVQLPLFSGQDIDFIVLNRSKPGLELTICIMAEPAFFLNTPGLMIPQKMPAPSAESGSCPPY